MILFLILHIYFVSFLDKPEKTAPQLSERAWEQRAKWDIPTDAMDYPVSSSYQNALIKMGVKIHHKSRWFNGVTCEMDEATAAQVAELKFVTNMEMTRENSDVSSQLSVISFQKSAVRSQYSAAGEEPENWTDKQLALYNLKALHEAGFEGQGILMAICDGSFYDADKLDCFRQKELELGHYDFTDDKEDFYGTNGAHGTSCLSTVSGVTKEYYGAATQAQYVLMRSEENATESPKEMDNLVVALEAADSLGVNIFSVSLGYAQFDNAEWDLDKSQLDGKSTRASLAATIAARKGMLVCVAAGNEGNKDWHTICIPADADSILSVGAVSMDSLIGTFSSYGPSADGRTKPEVCAVGVKAAIIRPSGEIAKSNGTSFATPLLAGMAACLWSALPKENAMQIRERIIRSADRFNNPDTDQYGYGIPDAWKAYKDDVATINDIIGSADADKPRKVLRGDQILIIRHGHIYNLAGQMVQ